MASVSLLESFERGRFSPSCTEGNVTVAEVLVSAVYCHHYKREPEVLGDHFHCAMQERKISVVLGFDEGNMLNLHFRLSLECHYHVSVILEHGCMV